MSSTTAIVIPGPCRRDFGTPVVAHVNGSYYSGYSPLCGVKVIAPTEAAAIHAWNAKNYPRRPS